MATPSDNRIETLLADAQRNQKMGALHEALAIYIEAIRLSPSNAKIHFYIGLVLTRLHKSEKALPFFYKAIELGPNHEEYWRGCLRCCISLGKTPVAKQILAKARNYTHLLAMCRELEVEMLSPMEHLEIGSLYKANDGNYLDFLRVLHERTFSGYIEIGSRTGSSLTLSRSPSIAIDPFFQLRTDPMGGKELCLLFQEKSDDFFSRGLVEKIGFQCELAFIDGMHLFEYALRDFLNIERASADDALFLFHDPLPWTFRMAGRNNRSLGRGEAWTGDIWKLAHIFVEFGLRDSVKLLTSHPSGLLALVSPDSHKIDVLRENYNEICAKWRSIEFSESTVGAFYNLNIFEKPENFLAYFDTLGIGDLMARRDRRWVSQ